MAILLKKLATFRGNAIRQGPNQLLSGMSDYFALQSKGAAKQNN